MIPKYICDACLYGPQKENICGDNTSYNPKNYCSRCEINGALLDINVENKSIDSIFSDSISLEEAKKNSDKWSEFLERARPKFY